MSLAKACLDREVALLGSLDKVNPDLQIGGVVGAWPLDEANAADPAVDYSGNKNDGVPSNLAVADGKFAGTKARRFNGVNSSIDHGVLDIGQQSHSRLVWFKRNGASGGTTSNFRHVVQTGINKHRDNYIAMSSGGSEARYTIRKSDGNYTAPSVAVTPSSDWVLLGSIFDFEAGNASVIYNTTIGAPVAVAPAIGTGWADNNSIRHGAQVTLSYNVANGDICLSFIILGKLTQAQLNAFYLNYPNAKIEQGKIHIRRDWRLPLGYKQGLDKVGSA